MNVKDRYYSIEVNLTSGRHEILKPHFIQVYEFRMPEMRDYYEKETIDFWVRKAPKIDKMITVTRAAGAKMRVFYIILPLIFQTYFQWDKVTRGFRDLILEEDSTPAKNETLIPVALVHMR